MSYFQWKISTLLSCVSISHPQSLHLVPQLLLQSDMWPLWRLQRDTKRWLHQTRWHSGDKCQWLCKQLADWGRWGWQVSSMHPSETLLEIHISHIDVISMKSLCYIQFLHEWTLLKCVLRRFNPPVVSLSLLVLCSCAPGSEEELECDPKLEAEVVKPEKCGKIKDNNGPFK